MKHINRVDKYKGDNNISKKLIYYYLVLTLFLFVIINPNSQFNEFIRIGYFILVLLPTFKHPTFTPWILTLYIGISVASFSPVLPTTGTFYIGFLVILIFVNLNKIKWTKNISIVIAFLYYINIEFFYGKANENFIVWVLVVILLSLFINKKEDVNKIAVSFVIVTLFLSILFLLYKDYFMVNHGRSRENLERVSWINPNVFGAFIALGSVVASYIYFNRKDEHINKIISRLCLVTICCSLFVLLLNASRGAIIATIIANIGILLLSKQKKVYILLFVIVLVVVFMYLYDLGYFKLIEARFMEKNAATAGGRTEIWEAKFFAFSNLPWYKQMFGIGYYNCVDLGWYFDTHNDFATALYGYGFVGLIIFIYLIIRPVMIASKEKRKIVLCFMIFFTLECFVVSPIFRGYYPYLMAYIFITRYAELNKKHNIIKSVLSNS